MQSNASKVILTVRTWYSDLGHYFCLPYILVIGSYNVFHLLNSKFNFILEQTNCEKKISSSLYTISS